MTDAPLVAVVTPVYNGEPWLQRTLANVQLQTYPNLVHVVLDNCSSDGTAAAIAKAVGGRIPIITRRNPEVLPQTANWNAAFALAPREAVYVKLNCADDLMRADAIEKLVAVAESDPTIDYVSAVDVFKGVTQQHGLEPSQTVYEGAEYGRRLLLGEIPWTGCHHAFFRADPSFVHRPFDERLASHSDAELLIARLLNRRMGFVFEPLYFTHFDEGTVTAQTGGARPSIAHHYRKVVQHGPRFLAPAEYEIALHRARGALLRHLPVWLATGDSKNLALAFQVLAAAKDRAFFSDYLSAALEWPAYKRDMYRARAQARRAVAQPLEADAFMKALPLAPPASQALRA